jgi:hypothetical protein
LWIQEKVREGRIQLVKVEGTENLADALTKYVDSDMLEKHIKGSECEVVGGRHELMPEVQSSEVDPKERQEAETADQDEDQLGHLGCLSHEESDHDNNNYQHNNEYKGHNYNEQMDEKEREYSSEESSSGLIDPRETKQIEVCKVNSSSVYNVQGHEHHKFSSDNERDNILAQCCNDLPRRGLKYRLNHKTTENQIQHQSTNNSNDNNNYNHHISSERRSSERRSSERRSSERSSSDSTCSGGSLTPKQCLGTRSQKEMCALVGHKTPLHHLSFECFWIELGAISCAHLIRRGAGDILRISPYGQVSMTCDIDTCVLNWLREKESPV